MTSLLLWRRYVAVFYLAFGAFIYKTGLTALTVIIHRATQEDILLSHAFFAYEGAGQMRRAAAI